MRIWLFTNVDQVRSALEKLQNLMLVNYQRFLELHSCIAQLIWLYLVVTKYTNHIALSNLRSKTRKNRLINTRAPLALNPKAWSIIKAMISFWSNFTSEVLQHTKLVESPNELYSSLYHLKTICEKHDMELNCNSYEICLYKSWIT